MIWKLKNIFKNAIDLGCWNLFKQDTCVSNSFNCIVINRYCKIGVGKEVEEFSKWRETASYVSQK